MEDIRARMWEYKDKLDKIAAIGPVQDPWDAGKGFCNGWDTCREKIKAILEANDES